MGVRVVRSLAFRATSAITVVPSTTTSTAAMASTIFHGNFFCPPSRAPLGAEALRPLRAVRTIRSRLERGTVRAGLPRLDLLTAGASSPPHPGPRP